ncbi:MAG TPA: sugar phosphate nucleotidyltransferase [Phycisphaerae bacterium]|nr:sugar phosphate nucleotidyltransferase [Phycisphaerae bacterium]
MRAIILAGGKGTRLRPFTTTIPKPIVPVGGMAIMEIVVRQLRYHGCDHITVAVNHMANLIMAFFGDGSRWGLKIDYSLEDKPLGTIGPLKLIEDLPENFLVMNGDVLTDLDFGDLYRGHVASKAMATVGTYERDVRIDFGVLRYQPSDRRIVAFVEKPTEHFSVSMGVYAFSRRILDIVPDDTPFGFDHLMLALIARKAQVHAYPFTGHWLDIGRPDDYDQANVDFERLRDKFLPGEPAGEGEP